MKKTILTSVCIIFIFLNINLFAVPIAGHSYPLFVTDSSAGNVCRIDSDGTVTTIVSGLTLPRAITYAPNGNIFVGQENGNIYKIQPSTGNKELFASVSGFVRGLAFGLDGNLYVAEATTGKITKINASGVKSTFVSGIGYAQGLAFDSSGDLYVATGGMGDNKIKKVKPDGTVSIFATTYQNPVPACFDLEGFPNGYLLSSENSASQRTLIKINSSGNVVKRVTSTGTNGINGIAITSDGYIYGDQGNNVLKMDSEFNEVGIIGGFSSLWGITATLATLQGSLDREGRAWTVCSTEGGWVSAEDDNSATIAGYNFQYAWVDYYFCLPYTNNGTVTQLELLWDGYAQTGRSIKVQVYYGCSSNPYYEAIDSGTTPGWRRPITIPASLCLCTEDDSRRILVVHFETPTVFDIYHLNTVRVNFSYSDPSLQKGDLDASYACSLANMQVDCFRNEINAYDMFQNEDPFSVDGKLFWSWAASVYQFAQHLQAVDVQSLIDLKDLPDGIQGLYNDIYEFGLFQALDVASLRFSYQTYSESPEPSSMASLMSNLQTNLSKAARRAGGVNTGAGTTRESCMNELYDVFSNQNVNYFISPSSRDGSFSFHSNNWYLGWYSAAAHGLTQDVCDMGLKAADAGLTMKKFGDAWLDSFVKLKVNANLPGISIQVNGNSYPAPKDFNSIKGMSHIISAPSQATIGGQNYHFTGWDDGGAQTHIIIPTADTIYEAQYALDIPPIPASIDYPSSSTGQYTVSWSSSSGATSYQLEISTNGGGSWSLPIDTGQNTSYPQNVGNGTYRYRVQATNAGGSSDWRTGTWDCVVFIIPGDFDGNGQENLVDFAIFASAWMSAPGQSNWNPTCDISEPKDNIIDWSDLAVFAENWLVGVE